MTVNTREYHRTFNILPPGGRRPSRAELDRELKEARAKYPGHPDHRALEFLWSHQLRTAPPVHDAFEDTGSEYKPARIEAKKDQNFEKYATRWEFFWSPLARRYGSLLTPVVDKSGAVIGYAGNIDYQYFLIEHRANSDPYDTPKAPVKSVDVLKHYRLFVGTNDFYGRKDLKVFGSNLHTRHTVVTDIYGEVMSYEVGGTIDHSISSISWLEIGGMLGLARTALRLTVSLGSTGLRTLTRRPPTPVETWMATKTLTVPSGRLLPTHVHHFKGGRRTLIAGEDMAASQSALAKSHTVSGFYDVAIHGNSTSFRLLEKTLPNGKRVFRDVSVRDVADAIRPHLAPGDKIRLFSCSVGVTGGPAQQLANELGRTVWAATTAVPKTPTVTPGVILTAFVPKGGGKFHEFLPQRGAAHLSGSGGKVTGDELAGEIRPAVRK